MGTAIKHHAPDRVKPSFVMFDIWALWRSGVGFQKSRELFKVYFIIKIKPQASLSSHTSASHDGQSTSG